MTYQTAYSANQPDNEPAKAGAAPAQPDAADHGTGGPRSTGAAASPPRHVAKRRGSGFLLAALLLIAVTFTFVMLSPDKLIKLVESLFERTPSATIAVAPAPVPPAPPATTSSAPLSPIPSAPRPSATSVVPPAGVPPASVAGSEPQNLRVTLADVTGRLGALEQQASATRQAALADRLQVLEARLAALIEQPAITPAMLADALTETRQAAQAAAQEAAQEAAQDAAQTVVRNAAQSAAGQAVQTALQESLQQTLAAQKAMAPAIAELEKRLAALEKMAPAVVSIADIDKRVMGLEKMAPAVVAIGGLERRLAGLETTMASANALADLDRRLAGVEKATGSLAAMSQSALQGESLALGLVNLRLALDQGTPYAEVLSALRVVAINDAVLSAEVDRLALNAARGVPSRAALRQRLLALPAAETVKPTAAPPPAAQPSLSSEQSADKRGVWADIGQQLASIVKIRRLEPDAASSPDPSPDQPGGETRTSAIERAAARLVGDDLPGAIAVLDSDGMRADRAGGSQVALQDWLRDARDRLVAETSLAILSRRSLALFSARAEALPPPAAPPASNAPPPAAPVGPGSATKSGDAPSTP